MYCREIFTCLILFRDNIVNRSKDSKRIIRFNLFAYFLYTLIKFQLIRSPSIIKLVRISQIYNLTFYTRRHLSR